MTSFISFIILDLIWFKIFTNDIFWELLKPIAKIKENSFDVNYLSAGIVYLLLALGVCFFILRSNHLNFIRALGSGAVLGLVTYGVYDFTNHALLAHWPVKMIVLDVTWGIFSCSMVSLFTFYIKGKL